MLCQHLFAEIEQTRSDSGLNEGHYTSQKQISNNFEGRAEKLCEFTLVYLSVIRANEKFRHSSIA
jgi:hypothetical protein